MNYEAQILDIEPAVVALGVAYATSILALIVWLA